MHHPALETIAERLSGQLRGAQEDLCRPIIHQITRGKPVTSATLRASLQVSQYELEQRLAQFPDVEFDRVGNIVGLGVSMVPTSHRFQIGGRSSPSQWWIIRTSLLLACPDCSGSMLGFTVYEWYDQPR